MGFSTQETQKNHQKPSKTRKNQNLETYVPFCGDLVAGSRIIKPSRAQPEPVPYKIL